MANRNVAVKLTGFLICLSLVSLVRGAESPTASLGCTEQFKFPHYPQLAKVAHIRGDATARVLIDHQGRPREITMSEVHPILTPAVKLALEGSRFSKKCGGKVLEFVFMFRMEGPRDKVQRVDTFFEFPNSFVVITNPPVLFP